METHCDKNSAYKAQLNITLRFLKGMWWQNSSIRNLWEENTLASIFADHSRNVGYSQEEIL